MKRREVRLKIIEANKALRSKIPSRQRFAKRRKRDKNGRFFSKNRMEYDPEDFQSIQMHHLWFDEEGMRLGMKKDSSDVIMMPDRVFEVEKLRLS